MAGDAMQLQELGRLRQQHEMRPHRLDIVEMAARQAEQADAHPQERRVDGTSPSVNIVMEIDLVAMSRNRTRMNVALDIRPRTIAARLVIQSLKLARQNVVKRFRKRIAGFAAEIEARTKVS
jgi:hypothetical protein